MCRSVDKVIYHPTRWLLAPIYCRLSASCMISVFTLTPICRCGCRSFGYVRSALLPCEAYGGQCHRRCYSRLLWACGAGVLKTRLWLCDSFRPSETVPGQAAVCAERTADLHRQSSGPRPASTAQPTLPSVPHRISSRLTVLVYRCLHGLAPGYLASELQRVSDLNARRRLRSSSSSAIV